MNNQTDNPHVINIQPPPAVLPIELQPTKTIVIKKERILNPRQEEFCKLYTDQDIEFFGNGTKAYIAVYKPDMKNPNWYDIARAAASQLLANINVCNRINELLETGGLNDQNIDKQLLFLVNQHKDFKSKIAAIKEYNALKARITKKFEHTGKDGQPLYPVPILGSEAPKE